VESRAGIADRFVLGIECGIVRPIFANEFSRRKQKITEFE